MRIHPPQGDLINACKISHFCVQSPPAGDLGGESTSSVNNSVELR